MSIVPNHDPATPSEFTVPLSVLEAYQDLARVVESSSGATPGEVGASASSQDRWRGWAGSINPLGDFSNKGVNRALNTLDSAISVLSSLIGILKVINTIINAFQTDFNNLFKVLEIAIQALQSTIEELLVSVSSTGIYVLPLVPNTSPFNPDTPAGGGFKEYMAKVNHALTNQKDPNRPIFFEGDYLGGILIALTAGTNAGDIVRDLSILARFIQDEPNRGQLAPVGSLTATPGLFYETEGTQTGLFDATSDVISAAFGRKIPGIKLSWSPPKGIPSITGYRIYRSRTEEGNIDGEKERVAADSLVNPGMAIRKYQDFLFNNGNPVEIQGSRDTMQYVDFEVEDRQRYFYKVIPLLKDSNNIVVEGEVITKYTSAVASACIPDDLLFKSYETPDGLLKGFASGDRPYWSNVTLRGFLGEEFDALLRNLAMLTDRLKGISVTSTSHFSKQIELMERWIANIQTLTTLIQNVLKSLRALQFSSSAMALSIPSESGGIEAFRKRVNEATMPARLKDVVDQGGLCSIYAGLVLVVGSVTDSSLDNLGGQTQEELAKIKVAGNFSKAKQAYKEQREVLKQYDSGGEASKNIDTVIRFFAGLFGG